MEDAGYGVCRLALVPVRSEAGDTSPWVSQLLFGEHYTVEKASADKKSLFIRQVTDDLTGWIDARQHHPITPEYFAQIEHTDARIVTDVTSPALYRKLPVTLLMGSVVPSSAADLFKVEEQFAFNGNAKALSQKRDAAFVCEVAKRYAGSPAVPGGKSPFGIDTTALVQMSFRIAGHSVPRDIKRLAGCGTEVGFAQCRPGDVALFAVKGNTISHAGLILDESRIIHAAGFVRTDILMEDGIVNPETHVYSHRLIAIRRLLA